MGSPPPRPPRPGRPPAPVETPTPGRRGTRHRAHPPRAAPRGALSRPIPVGPGHLLAGRDSLLDALARSTLRPGALVDRALPTAVGLVGAAGKRLDRDLVLRALRLGGQAPLHGGLEAVARGGEDGQAGDGEEPGVPVPHAVAASSGCSV